VFTGMPRAITTHAACAQYIVLASRGSGDPLSKDRGLGAPDRALVDSLKSLAGSGNVSEWANPYPAVGFSLNPLKWRQFLNGVGTILRIAPVGAYNASVNQGKALLLQQLEKTIKSCPSSHIVLAGYSQGAQIAADVYQRELSDSQRAAVTAMILFGDPYFRAGSFADMLSGPRGAKAANGVLGRRSEYPESADEPLRILSFCQGKDPVCQGGIGGELGALSIHAHSSYPNSGDPQQAARFIVGLATNSCVDQRIYMIADNLDADPEFSGIVAVNPDGSGGVQPVLNTFNMGYLEGLATDNKHLYFTIRNPIDAGVGIFEANLDGTGVHEITPVAFLPGAITVGDGQLYYASGEDVYRANLDGSGVRKVFAAEGPNSVGALAERDGMLYFSDDRGVGRVSVDGTGAKDDWARVDAGELLTTPTHLYWSTAPTLGRMRLDGSNVNENFVTFPKYAGGGDRNFGLGCDRAYYAQNSNYVSGGIPDDVESVRLSDGGDRRVVSSSTYATDGDVVVVMSGS
jgi:hypothetical protein